MIETLFEAPATFETVRDSIYNILDTEQQQQQDLATADGKDPNDYALNLFLERVAPIDPSDLFDVNNNVFIPVVIVKFRDTNLDNSTSTGDGTFKYSGTFDIEVIAGAQSTEDGNLSGDYLASYRLDRAIKLIMNILNYSEYKLLGFAPSDQLIAVKKVQTITKNEPDRDYVGSLRFQGANITILVDYKELGAQAQYENLEKIEVITNRSDDDFNLFVAEYDKGS